MRERLHSFNRYLRRWSYMFDQYIPLALTHDLDVLRRCRIIIGASLSLGFLTLALSLARFILEGWNSAFGWFLGLSSLVMLSSTLILRWTQSFYVAGSIIPTVGVSTLFVMAIYEGGFESDAIYWFPFAPLIAAFFVNALAGIFFGLLMLAGLIAIYYGHQFGLITPSTNSIEVQLSLKFMAAAATVIFGASVAWLYETNRRNSLSALHKSNAQTEAIISAIPDIMFLVNHNGLILDIKMAVGNSIFKLLHHFHDHKFTTIMDLFSAMDNGRIISQLKSAINTGVIQIEEYDLEDEEQNLSLEVRIVPSQMGEVLTIIRDVTSERNVERLKNEFLSMVSHELRTPLTAIVGNMGLLAGGTIPGIPKPACEMLENANRNAKRLNVLIDDLLDLQKISSGHIQYSMKNVEVGEFIKMAIELNRGYASTYNVELIYDNFTADSKIRIDESRMQQVMANLISNAVKYSPTGGEVLVQAQKSDDLICISVTDKGSGIPENFREQVFEKFTQSDSSTTRKVGGTGLGLNISKMIVEAHGGKIDFETEVGTGTTFTIYLPVVAA